MAEKKTVAEAAPKKKRCFMITPIGEAGSNIRQHADWVYNLVLAPMMTERGYEVARADKMHDPLMITDSIFEALTQSEVCVADLTMLNANVFYELGIRHALELPVIHIAQSGTALPFDNAGYRTIMFDRQCYDSMMQLKADIMSQMDTIERPNFKLSNPLTQFRGREKLASSSDSKDQIIADLQVKVMNLARRLDRAEVTNQSSGYISAERAWSKENIDRALSVRAGEIRAGISASEAAESILAGVVNVADIAERYSQGSVSAAGEAAQAQSGWARGVSKGTIPSG